MRKITEVLRLKFAAKLSHDQIARAVGLSKGVVGKYISLAKAQGLSWPLPEGMDEDALERRLYPPRQAATRFAEPDHARIHTELKRKGVTLQLLWAEYVAEATVFASVRSQVYPKGLHVPVNPLYQWTLCDFREKSHKEVGSIPSQDQLPRPSST